jgi:hypothetical protein
MMPNMTTGELVYKQGLENGYDPEKTAGIFSPIQESIKRSLKQCQSLAKDIEIPLKIVNSIAESIRPQLKVLDGIKISPLPKIPEFPQISMPVSEVLEDYYIKPQDRVHKVEVTNPPVFSHTKEESVPVVVSTTRNAVFYIKGEDIYRHEIGRLRYKLRGVNEPKYIKAFKNVIRYYFH